MAVYIAAANGNFSAGATWAAAASAAGTFLDSEAGNTATTTSPVASSTFQPGAITVDGMAVKVGSRGASPTGTFTVELFNSTGSASVASVTINISDITTTTARYGWLFLKFASVTLLAATNYTIRVSSTSAAQLAVYRDSTAGNWSRFLRTTTTGVAPVAGDILIVAGEITAAATVTARTVTYDITATTAWGTPGTSATAICASHGGAVQGQTTASTAYKMYTVGNIEVQGNATWTFNNIVSTSSFLMNLSSTGTTAGTGITTATLYGLILTAPASFTMVGKTVTNVSALLAADAAAAATSLTTNISTGWATTDALAIATTSQTFSQAEKRTPSAVSGTTLTVTALTNAHSGTSPNQAEIVNLTRSFVIQGDATNGGYIITNGTTQGFTFQYVEFTALGNTVAVNCFLINNTAGGTKTIQYCSFHDFIPGVTQANGVATNTNSTALDALTVDSCVFYAVRATNHLLLSTTSGTITATNNIDAGGGTNTGTAFNFGAFAGTVSNNTVSGAGTGITFTVGAGSAITTVGNLVHGCSTTCLTFLPPPVTLAVAGLQQTLSGWTVRRSAGVGVDFSGGAIGTYPSGLIIDSLTVIGCATSGVNLYNAGNTRVVIMMDCQFTNWVVAGEASFAQPIGVQVSGASSIQNCTFTSCTFGVGTAHTTADFNFASPAWAGVKIMFLNCNLASTGKEVVGQANMAPESYLKHQMWKQTTGSHRTYFQSGTVTRDTSIFNIASPSERLTPISASLKLASEASGIPCDSGATISYSVWIRRSVVGDGAAYNGNAPRLILSADVTLGYSTSTVLATSSGVAGTWEKLTATITAPTDDGVPQVYLDVDGTAGWVNKDDAVAA